MSQFWSGQPVPQSTKQIMECEKNTCIIEEVDIKSNVQLIPISLPNKLSWYDVDYNNENDLDGLYSLLTDHYVESEDFRFNYSKEFLRWALYPPGYKQEWHLSIRSDIGSRPIVGFISGIPVNICVRGETIKMVEINFLCVHNKCRKCNLAPI
jgi:glycylpeptide N-tetradecanoyltransferase